MAAGYGELLRTRHAARLLTGTLIGRLPNATAALAILLLARAEGCSYALAGAQGVLYAVGPLLVTLLVATASEAAALLVINALGVAGALSVVVSAPSRRWRSGPREAHWLGALRSPGLRALLGAFLCVGAALGAIPGAAVPH